MDVDLVSEVPPFTVVDLFAGCGGLTQGFVATGGFRPTAAVELDPHAAATYAANFGDHVHVGDISQWLHRDLPKADVVVGGPPCQGFSNLGTRQASDPRNSLWLRYVDAITRIKPQFFVIENVPLFMRSDQFDSLEQATKPGGSLDAYRLEPWELDASHYGAPQRRKRAIIIGSLRSLAPLGGVPRPAGGPRTVRDAISDLDPRVSVTELPERVHAFREMNVPGPFKSHEIHVTRTFRDISHRRFAHIPEGGNRFDLPDHLKADCWKRHTTGATDVMGRLRWDSPSVTVRTEFFKPEKGRYLHPEEDRPITHLEAARLQDFPDDFVWCGTKMSIARQIGNAVPVPLANSIAGHILRSLRSGD